MFLGASHGTDSKRGVQGACKRRWAGIRLWDLHHTSTNTSLQIS